MADVLLLSAAPREDDAFDRLRRYAAHDRFGVHTLVEDPEKADLILFVESWGVGPFFEEVRRHPYVKQYREKCFCFGERCETVPFLPGVYHDIDRRWSSRDRVRGGFFIWEFTNPYATYAPMPASPSYLFSFIGSRFTHAVRNDVLALEDPRGFVQDTGQDIQIWQTGTDEEKDRYWRRYGELCKDSSFILCPRGTSPASVRTFDSMKMGRVPVIISDQWVPPEGPDWDSFSLRVPEAEVGAIPALLREREPDAVAMGQRAREAWDTWFGKEVCFHRIVEWCLDIQATRTLPERVLRFKALRQLLFTHRLRGYLTTRLHIFREQRRLVF